MLINEIVNFCDEMYDKECTYECDCGRECNHDCKECLDDIHHHHKTGRKDYECEKLLYYYVCRYSYKYCSEIIYALEKVDLSKYTDFNILSLGCGGATDLMAFDYMCSDKINSYLGIDVTEAWETIHNKISECDERAEFERGIDVLSPIELKTIKFCNALIIEYLISYFYKNVGDKGVYEWCDLIIDSIVAHKQTNSLMLIIINDVDSCYTGRDTFKYFLDRLQQKGYNYSYKKLRFNKESYYDSQRHESDENKFKNKIDYNFQQKYCVPINCTSVQLIIEVE